MKNKEGIKQKLKQNRQQLEDIKREAKSLKPYNTETYNVAKKDLTSGGLAFNISIELIAAAIVGVIMGLFFDKMFDSKPLFLIICLILSVIAAFWSIWKKYVDSPH
jgi:ATP synthase protein I